MPKPIPGVTPEMILAAVSEDEMTGFCVACGAEGGPVEPDGRIDCEDCGKRRGCIGAELLLLQGYAGGY